MQLIGFAVVLTLGLFVAPLRADASLIAFTTRLIAARVPGDRRNPPKSTQAFRRGLQDLGYVEGRNIVTEIRSAEGARTAPALAAELIALRVDVIVAAGGTAPRLPPSRRPRRSHRLPAVDDPVTSGLVPALRGPAISRGWRCCHRRLVGVSGAIKEAVPWVSRVAVLWQPYRARARREGHVERSGPRGRRAQGRGCPS
jgi:putative ABC transport system substrate-binding protein